MPTSVPNCESKRFEFVNVIEIFGPIKGGFVGLSANHEFVVVPEIVGSASVVINT